LAAAQGFTEYSYAFVDSRVDETKDESLARANALRDHARKLYLRAYKSQIERVPLNSRSFPANVFCGSPLFAMGISASC